MLQATRAAFSKYADFRGVLPRREFWRFIAESHSVLILLLLPSVIAFLEFFHIFIEDIRVLDGIVAIIENPLQGEEIVREHILPVVHELAAEYMQGFPASHLLTTVTALLALAWGMFLVIPTVAAIVRRLRDGGQSLWWLLSVPLSCVPEPICGSVGFVLSVGLVLMCCQPTKRKSPGLPF